jgi:hypothetical protein
MEQQQFLDSINEQEETISAPRFNIEAARNAKPVVPLSQFSPSSSTTEEQTSTKKGYRWSTILPALLTLMIGVVGGLFLSLYYNQPSSEIEQVSSQSSSDTNRTNVWQSNPLPVKAEETANIVTPTPVPTPAISKSNQNENVDNQRSNIETNKNSNIDGRVSSSNDAKTERNSKETAKQTTENRNNNSNRESERPRRIRDRRDEDLSKRVNHATKEIRRVGEGLLELFEGGQ